MTIQASAPLIDDLSDKWAKLRNPQLAQRKAAGRREMHSPQPAAVQQESPYWMSLNTPKIGM